MEENKNMKTYSIRLHKSLKSYLTKRGKEEFTTYSEYLRRLIVKDMKGRE